MRSPDAFPRPTRAAALAVAIATAALTAVGASPADAQRGFTSRSATFDLRLKGVQTTTWSAQDSGAFGCDGPVRVGRGSERITFRSKWLRVKLTTVGSKDAVAIFTRAGSKKQPELRLSGTVTRRSQDDPAPVKPECVVADGNGTWEPTPPDCGKKKFSGLEVAPDVTERNGKRYLKVRQLNRLKKPNFAECWIEGFAWPTLLQVDDKNKAGVVTRWEPRDVFGTSRRGKQIWIGRGERTNRSFGSVAKTKIEWSYTARKVRKAK